jgi:hypothetical protein
MKKIQNRNLENSKKLLESRFFVFKKLIYTQKIPFIYTVLTKEALFYGVPSALMIGGITNGMAGGGLFTWSISLFFPILFYIYKNKINISYINRFRQILLLRIYEDVMKGAKKRLRNKRTLSLAFVILLSNTLTPLQASMASAVDDYNAEIEKFIEYVETKEKTNKYSKSSIELKKFTSTEVTMFKVEEINSIIQLQTKIISITKD